MNSVRVHEAAVTMSMVDGELLSPQQMSRIVSAVLAELHRGDTAARSRADDTRVEASSGAARHDQQGSYE